MFGIRGGGFFGNRFGRSKSNSSGGGGDDDDGKPKRFKALTQEEIEEKLNIPIYGLTDASGNGVILSGDNGSNIFHFFFNKHMADVALKSVSNANKEAPPLKVSAFHLGKCWFKLINKSGEQEYTLQKYGGKSNDNINDDKKEEIRRTINFHLVPNMKDLMGARVLTGLNPNDIQQLKDAVEEPNYPKAVSIVQQAAQNDKASFTSPFNEIPVFCIAQMRVRKKDEEGNACGENMLPFHLSTKTMSDTWNEFVKQSPEFADSEATLQLIELHKMIEMMREDSDIDFRNVVFVHPEYDNVDGKSNNDTDDDSDDDDDSGGGGDNGMKADTSYDDEISIEPYISMEVFANDMSSGQPTLMQLNN